MSNVDRMKADPGTRVCGHCGAEDCRVAETRLGGFWPFRGNVVRRRRICKKCYRSWWTIEITEAVAVALARQNEDALAAKAETFVASSLGDPLGED